MDPLTRFEILQPIAQGDFATVYRARDRELAREVAIKQIHAQFLQDPRHLDRYWQEAQILASLEHPHIVRIYDIVRERGWLVLELMQGSLKQMLGGRPVDLGDLRMTLTYSAHALQFMHANGILHGDVKPTNLLVDKSNRVKLGDFGIARRLAGDHGSVVKGTTRYMAPEVVSDQFGPVGPHSDLYSLGFSAYELLCGENFDSLFPGLNMYGRDQQIAWMMWHSALDRRLPDIQRVLEGVPADLAYVIQRLVEKDVTKRYRSAAEVIADLKSGATSPSGPSAEDLAAAEADQLRQAKRKRWLAIGACALSVSATIAMFVIPGPAPPPPAAAPADVRPVAGRIGEIDAQRGVVFIQPEGDGKPHGLEFHPDRDRIFINDQKSTLADLRRDEQVEIRYLSSGAEEFFELNVKRAAESDVQAVVTAVDPATATITLAASDGGESQTLYVPDSATISLNGQTQAGGRKLRLDDLLPDDRVASRVAPSDEGRMVALVVAALRRSHWQGVVTNRLPTKNQFEVRLTAVGTEPGAPPIGATKLFTLAAECRLSINGQNDRGGQAWSLADLQVGDVVKLEADSLAHAVTASREQRAEGKIAQVDPAERTISLAAADGTAPRKFRLAAQGTIRLANGGATVDLGYLRPGDAVALELATAVDESGDRVADRLQVTPAVDPRAWAVLITQSDYEDARLPKLAQPKLDAATLRTALTQRYRIPEAQILQLDDASRLRLTQELGAFLANVKADSQLFCFYDGLAFLDPTGAPMLAPKEFDAERAAETGTPFRWLVDQIGGSAAKEKILLVDASPAVEAAKDRLPVLSTYEIVEALRPKPTRPISANVLIVGSCEKGQRSRALKPDGPDMFAATVAAALAGAADANRDARVSGVELVEYVVRETAVAAGSETPQRAVAWQPDARAPRLDGIARKAVDQLLTQIRLPRPSDTVSDDFQTADQKAGKEPDVRLAYALVMLKHNRTPVSRPIFEKIRTENPKRVVAHQALAWQNFLQGKQVEGLADLKLLVDNLPDPKEQPDAAAFFQQAVELAGTLREYSLRAAEPPVDPAATKALDQAVIARGDDAKAAYQKGIEAVRVGLKRIDEDISTALDPTKQRSLQLDRKRATYYATFNFAVVADYIKQQADE